MFLKLAGLLSLFAVYLFEVNAQICLDPPHYVQAKIGFDANGTEALSWNSILLQALTKGLKEEAKLIDSTQGQSECIKKARIRIVSYTLRPRRLGQRSGTLTLDLEIFEGKDLDKSVQKLVVSKEGGLDWGENAPFENALNKVADEIMKQLRKK
jgi:hypothetical protein